MATKPRLLIVGAGFAGLTLAKKADAFCDVTIVDPKSYFELTWAVPRGLLDSKVAERSTFAYKDVPGLGRFVQATVSSLSSKEAVLSNGETVPFDYCAVCVGTSNGPAFKSQSAKSREERLAELKAIGDEIRAAKSVAIIGGGPVGVEAAAEIVEVYAGKAVTLVHPGEHLLTGQPPKLGQESQKWLEAHGVKVLLQTRVEGAKPGDSAGRGPTSLPLKGGPGGSLQADLVLWCTGSAPNSGFLRDGELAGVLNERGQVKVEPTLQVVGHPHMFALGDITSVDENKMGFLATKHAELAAKSIQAMVKAGGPSKAGKLGTWKPNMGTPSMIVTLGRAAGACRVGGSVCTGCLPTNIKSKGLFVDQYRAQLGLKD
ncbi:hypothetical protein HYH03_017133 [Edaphochlamys debaryana]|uniref:FAD/NAD(P)-binding domain-containing protein n=1 Tax=Edaphochlamys debaryana TaxID=47281 RepID=A0A835XJN8_9CHLO|nr:hypothetical protein HYH03_017133 [Edaphochlamys debaryana]|eukprot:KAG2484043.1 hypothetical protein HYH03_017133 [Edaphochlamys debaryana]